MILRDTNVLSEVASSSPSRAVTAWMDAQAAGELLLATPVISEMWLGVRLIANARKSGHTIGVMDGQIAAIAHVRRAKVATRDTTPSAAVGVPTINPWQP